MEAYRYLNTLMGAIAMLTIVAHVVGIAVSSIRTRRAGAPAARVGAGITSQLIGLGLAVAGAMGSGYIMFSILWPIGLQPAILLIIQVLAALMGSWLIGRLYLGWLARPVYNWFAGEEGAAHDR